MPSLADQMRTATSRIGQRGDELNREQQNRAELEAGRAGRYRDWGEQEATRLMEEGGYTQEELDRILGDRRLDGIEQGGDYSQFGLSDDDVTAMYGNGSDRYRYMSSWDDADAEQSQFGTYMMGNADRLGDDLNGAVGDDLKLRDQYGNEIMSDLDKSDSEAKAAINKDDLTMSQDFVDRYRMRDEDRMRIENAGALAIRDRGADDMGAAERAAAGSGSGTLGMAALRNRTSRRVAADAADALTKGRVIASEAQAGREKTIEDTRLDSGARYAGMESDRAMRSGDRRANARTTVEGMRLDASRDISDRRTRNATTTAGARADAATAVQGSGQRNREFYTGMGTEIATGLDRDNRNTAAAIAGNRQQTARDINADRFTRQTYGDAARTQRGAGTADARRDDNREGRAWLTGQQNTANSNSQNEYNRQVQTYDTQSGAVNSGNANTIKADTTPKWWERLATAGMGAAATAYAKP